MISVCMATFNGGQYLKAQIDSILNQLSVNDELVISDDHSTDNTCAIIKQYNDSRVKLVLNELTKGVTHNFENALLHSNGDIIFLADQDDIWHLNKVEKILTVMNDDILAISSSFDFINQDDQKFEIKQCKAIHQLVYRIFLFHPKCIILANKSTAFKLFELRCQISRIRYFGRCNDFFPCHSNLFSPKSFYYFYIILRFFEYRSI